MPYTFFLLSACLTIALSFGAAKGQDADRSGESIIRKMVATYARFSSYEDRGTVQRVSADRFDSARVNLVISG
jgi:hypothetical protein